MSNIKKTITGILLAAIALLALGMIGCGNKRIDNEALEKEFENAPEWVLTGHEQDVFSAVGSARIGDAGMQFAKNAALAQARNELANRLSVRINSMVNSFTRQTGLGDDQMVDRLGKQVIKQVTSETLAGSRQEDVWISPRSDLYVLVVMDGDIVKNAVRSRIISSFKQEEAKWQEFKAREGNRELDQAIDDWF